MTDQPTASAPDPGPGPEAGSDDGGAALERSAASIREAKDAEGTVAAHEDITTLDAQRAETHSEDPGAEGDHA